MVSEMGKRLPQIFDEYIHELVEEKLQKCEYVINEIYWWGCYREVTITPTIGNKTYRAKSRRRTPDPNWW